MHQRTVLSRERYIGKLGCASHQPDEGGFIGVIGDLEGLGKHLERAIAMDLCEHDTGQHPLANGSALVGVVDGSLCTSSGIGGSIVGLQCCGMLDQSVGSGDGSGWLGLDLFEREGDQRSASRSGEGLAPLAVELGGDAFVEGSNLGQAREMPELPGRGHSGVVGSSGRCGVSGLQLGLGEQTGSASVDVAQIGLIPEADLDLAQGSDCRTEATLTHGGQPGE